MTDDISIKVENVTKTYRLYASNLDRVKESLDPRRRKYHHDFFALRDISFEIKKGEVVGIIGKNGSGKSTLLKLITGVLTPTHGSITVNGRVSALLELGSGFNPELTGVQNVYFNGTLMGYSREEMDSRLDDILSFADIGEFVNQPIKSYSSGMFVRLAFAVAINVDPDILIIDEALSVGDIKFQRKCFSKIEGFKEKGKTILFVSHDTGLISNLCKSAILLDAGKLISNDEPRIVSKTYIQLIYGEDLVAEKDLDPSDGIKYDSANEALIDKDVIEERRALRASALSNIGMVCKPSSCELRHGNGDADIIGFGIFDSGNNRVNRLRSGEKYTLFFYVLFYKSVTNLFFATAIRDTQGINLFVTNSEMLQLKVADQDKGDLLLVSFEVNMSLGAGDYFMSCVVMDYNNSVYLDRRLDVFHFTIGTHDSRSKGFVNLMPSMNLKQIKYT